MDHQINYYYYYVDAHLSMVRVKVKLIKKYKYILDHPKEGRNP
jgi:hypothetical protein